MKTYSKYFLVAIALILLGGLLFITLAIMDAQEKLAEEKRLLERKDNTLFPFTAAHQQRLDENRREGWQQLTHLEDTTAVVNHEGFLYLATGGGLLKFSLSWNCWSITRSLMVCLMLN